MKYKSWGVLQKDFSFQEKYKWKDGFLFLWMLSFVTMRANKAKIAGMAKGKD